MPKGTFLMMDKYITIQIDKTVAFRKAY
uniref:Uncharacterized protein n=1 Tax=Arundo donax TaxID=35708 RepID=A0A0A9ACB4_ARUDO